MQSARPSPGVFGPLSQGTRTPEIIFLLVEGQRGARIEKGKTHSPLATQSSGGTLNMSVINFSLLHDLPHTM